MSGLRLGDIIDDYCTRCRLPSNHSVVAMLDSSIRKVRCRTCQYEHEFRHGKGGTKKSKPSAFDQILASMNAPLPGAGPAEPKPRRARRERT